MPVVFSLISQSRRWASSSRDSRVLVTTCGAPAISFSPLGPQYVPPGRSAVAAIRVGQAPAAGDWETALIAASRIDAMPPEERPY